MSDNEERDNRGIVHYEGGIPVFNNRLDKLENEAREAKTRDEQYKQEQLKLNRRLVWFTGVLAFVGILGGGISAYQTHISGINADAAKANADAAKNMVEEMKKSGNDTHELAIQARNQADRTKEIADRALVQANASNELARQTKRSADAATNAANTATNALAQGNISWLHPDFEAGDIPIAVNAPIREPFSVTNLGRGPAVGIEGSVNAELVRMEDAPMFDYNGGEAFYYAGVLSPNATSSKILVPVPDLLHPLTLGADLLLSDKMVQGIHDGKLFIALYGRITYRDLLFPKKKHWIQFCTNRTQGNLNHLPVRGLQACLNFNQTDEE